MPTLLKIPEESFRIGAGRYIQNDGAINLVGEECIRLGCKKPIVIGGKTALSLTKEKLQTAFNDCQMDAIFVEYKGFCCKETCAEIMQTADFESADIVIGVGGGNVMDAAKYCAVVSNKPIINVPTSSATCAAYTPLSVCYNKQGQTVGTVHHKVEVNCVIVDMEILCRQPVRLMLAGVYDSLAKQYELHQRMLGVSEDDMDIGLLASYKTSNFLFDFLIRKTADCIDDLKKGLNSKTVYDIVYACIALTGVVSGLARGSNQTAIAHKIYETARKLYPLEVYDYLHGEMVAIGLIAQIAYNGEGGEEEFAQKLKSYDMPVSLSDMGIQVDDECMQAFYDKLISSAAMAGTTDEEKSKLKKVLNLIR